MRIAGVSLSICSGALSVAFASAGFAQSAPSASPAGSDVKTSTSQTADTRGSSLAEIVVVAQKRSEKLQDVPLSITTQTAEELERRGVTSTKDIALVSPGVQLNFIGAYGAPSIRGVTTNVSAVAVEANVATYLDGIYQPSQTGISSQLPDVERIEIARGPQGTLFGRNATGGAIQIFTRQPTRETTGDIAYSYGSYNEHTVKGYLSGPIADDKVGFSLAGYYGHNDGWVKDIYHGTDPAAPMNDYTLRGKLSFTPLDGAKFVLSAGYSHVSDPTFYYYSIYHGIYSGKTIDPQIQLATRPWQSSPDAPLSFTTNIAQYGLRGEIQVPYGTITSMTGYYDERTATTIDADGGPLTLAGYYDIRSSNKAFNQEIDFASDPFGPLSFVAGLFYYSSDARYEPLDIVFPGSVTEIVTHDKHIAAAAFGELSYRFNERLKFILGGRYSYEKPSATDGIVGVVYNDLGSRTYNSFTPRFSAMYAVSDDTNVYFTYSQGFKSGAYNSSSFQLKPVAPEKIKAYEVGVKSLLTPELSLDAAIYKYDYTDIQVQSIVNSLSVLQNAASEKIYGGELALRYQPSSAWTLDGSVAYLHARYASFPNALEYVPAPGDAGNIGVSADASDTTPPRSPELTFSFTPSYRHAFDQGTLTASTTLYVSSKSYYDVGQHIEQPGYALINARFGWQPANSNFRFSVWGKNLTDRAVISAVSQQNFASLVAYAPPRQIGAEIAYGF